MKQIIKYTSSDNKEFSSEEECLKYENILNKVESLLNPLPFNESSSFFNGGGYIQHSKEVRKQLEKAIIALSNEYFSPKKPFKYFNYYLGRVIDDSGMLCLNRLFTKIMCIDEQSREWGQPYYALNPSKGKQLQLNQ